LDGDPYGIYEGLRKDFRAVKQDVRMLIEFLGVERCEIAAQKKFVKKGKKCAS
jgi:hypothetical protein